jgi:hypothetical protein
MQPVDEPSSALARYKVGFASMFHLEYVGFMLERAIQSNRARRWLPVKPLSGTVHWIPEVMSSVDIILAQLFADLSASNLQC